MSRPLRIAQVAPIARPVAATSTGSIEQIVWLLTEDLVQRDHDVTLFATGHSETSARLESIYERGYDDDEALWEWTFHELLHVAAAMEAAHEFDVVHSHDYHFALPFTRLVPTPIVHSYHVLPDDDVVRAYRRYPEALLVAISAFQREQLGAGEEMPLVPHGLAVEAFPFRSESGDYLVFVGNLGWEKGAVEAAQLAARIGLPLVMAGPGEEFYGEHVAPLGGDVEHLGWVDPSRRNELLAGAAALLYPLNIGETFGLVMLEAMACGTPVLATSQGAVPEIVENGVTGFHAETLDELAERAPAALALERSAIRARAAERFGKARMVDGYEALYRGVAPEAKRRSA